MKHFNYETASNFEKITKRQRSEYTEGKSRKLNKVKRGNSQKRNWME